MENVLCIYHGNCADGFTAAWAVHKALSHDESIKTLAFFAGIYGQDAPDCTGKDVVIVDFSYKRPVMDAIIQQAKSVIILDHHKSAEAELDGIFTTDEEAKALAIQVLRAEGKGEEQAKRLAIQEMNKYKKVRGIFDMTKSGAMLAWNWFHKSPPPRLVVHVQDRDLWKFNLENTRAISAAVFSHAYTFENWDNIANDLESPQEYMNVVAQGEAIERKHFKDVDELLKVCRRTMKIGGHVVPVANMPYTLVSDAATKMAKGQPFAACYWDTPDGRVFGLRSEEGAEDVAEIAMSYGGGGHANAAGFTVSYDELEQFNVQT